MTDFETHRNHLRGVAFRMLGSLSEADDAVQEAWLRLERADTSDVANLRGWLTTVVSRVCLDMLRSRTSRREDPVEEAAAKPAAGADAEQELILADQVGLALMVVLDKLDPAERLAFVLHDLFAIPFDEIATIVHRTPEATRQLASRARRRVQGAPAPDVDLAGQRTVVDAFMAALRSGDLEALIATLDPDVVVVATDPTGTRREVRGARTWATSAVAGAAPFAKALALAAPALVGGAIGIVIAPNGKLFRALRFEFAGDKISRAEVIINRAELDALEIGALD